MEHTNGVNKACRNRDLGLAVGDSILVTVLSSFSLFIDPSHQPTSALDNLTIAGI